MNRGGRVEWDADADRAAAAASSIGRAATAEPDIMRGDERGDRGDRGHTGHDRALARQLSSFNPRHELVRNLESLAGPQAGPRIYLSHADDIHDVLIR